MCINCILSNLLQSVKTGDIELQKKEVTVFESIYNTVDILDFKGFQFVPHGEDQILFEVRDIDGMISIPEQVDILTCIKHVINECYE